ncbi:MAG: hypothetical protein WD737_09350 [Gemmatimonadota bacterium]
MPDTTCRLEGTPEQTAPAFTIRSILVARGQRVEQVQYVASSHVVTEVNGSTFLYAPGLGGRFTVQREQRLLRRLPSASGPSSAAHVRALLGNLKIDEPPGEVPIAGHSCRLIRILNRDAKLVLTIETYCTRLKGLERTALRAERAFDAPHQPFVLPLTDDEVVVRSVTRALAADFEQSQRLELAGIRPGIPAEWQASAGLLDYPVLNA